MDRTTVKKRPLNGFMLLILAIAGISFQFRLYHFLVSAAVMMNPQLGKGIDSLYRGIVYTAADTHRQSLEKKLPSGTQMEEAVEIVKDSWGWSVSTTIHSGYPLKGSDVKIGAHRVLVTDGFCYSWLVFDEQEGLITIYSDITTDLF